MSKGSSHYEDTLRMARELLSPSVAQAQVALNLYWERYGEPPEELRDHLRERLREATNDVILDFFQEWVKRA